MKEDPKIMIKLRTIDESGKAEIESFILVDGFVQKKSKYHDTICQ